MRKPALLLILLALLGGMAHAAPSWEAQGFAHRPVADDKNGSRISLDQAVKKVQRETGGRILSASTQGEVHKIKVLTPDNRVRIVSVPARK